MYIGLDISWSHLGMVLLGDDGLLKDYAFVTELVKYHQADPHRSIRLQVDKSQGKEMAHLEQTQKIRTFVMNKILVEWGDVDVLWGVSVEGYGYSSQSPRLFETVEMTGILKHYILNSGAYLRIHDPDSVKLFATNYGHALKKDMVDAARNFLEDQSFCEHLRKDTTHTRGSGAKKKKLPEYDGPITDICDAFWLARMLWTEDQVRSGNTLLSSLNEGERRVFIRTTKSHPVNVLDQPYLTRKRGC